MKSIKYLGLAQSYASLPPTITTTGALISTLCTRKLHCQNATKSAKLVYRAQALPSHILLGQDEEKRICQAKRGRKQRMSL